MVSPLLAAGSNYQFYSAMGTVSPMSCPSAALPYHNPEQRARQFLQNGVSMTQPLTPDESS